MSKRRAPARQGTSFWRGPWPIIGSLLAIVLVIVAFVFLSRTQSPTATTGSRPIASGDLIARLSGVTPATIDAVGTAGSPNPLKAASGAALTGSNGKPEVLYIGAEWCPYCAAERWAMIVALSHFGSFQGLVETTSSSSDVFPDTPTLSFAGATYTSIYLDFVPVELQDRNRQPLQTMTTQQQQIAQALDPSNGIPFLDLANKFTLVGQGVRPDPLQGLNWHQIANALSNPASPVTIAVVANADYLTGGLCMLPGAGAAPICADPVIKAITAQLGA